MSKTCSTCGQQYPDEFITCTCRFCGGLIEPTTKDLLALNPRVYEYETQWQEWKKKYDATPPRPLNEDSWLKMCAYMNCCSICGGSIEEKLLVIPPVLGGRLYAFNVVPSCEVCAKRVRQSQVANPLKSLYTVAGSNKSLVDLSLKYLEAVMLGTVLEDFNFEQDKLEIIVKVTEDTSIKPFNGVYAKRVFTDPGRKVLKREFVYAADKPEEFSGITWRLLDEDD